MIYIGTDHAGFAAKEHIKRWLTKRGYDVTDLGAHSYDRNDDYPDFIIPVAKAVREHPGSYGIILGGSGQGEAITANSLPHIRAAVYYGGPREIVRLARSHNNATILSLGARFMSKRNAIAAVREFLETPFSGDERHVRRLVKEDQLA